MNQTSQEENTRLILFICTGNTCRSPMAAALFNYLNPPEGWRAESAGLAAFTGEPASQLARTALQLDFDLDLAGHRSQPVRPDLLAEAAWILTMTRSQSDALQRAFPEYKDKIRTIGEMAGEPERAIPDPFGRDLADYQETAAALAELIEQIYRRIRGNA